MTAMCPLPGNDDNNLSLSSSDNEPHPQHIQKEKEMDGNNVIGHNSSLVNSAMNKQLEGNPMNDKI